MEKHNRNLIIKLPLSIFNIVVTNCIRAGFDFTCRLIVAQFFKRIDCCPGPYGIVYSHVIFYDSFILQHCVLCLTIFGTLIQQEYIRFLGAPNKNCIVGKLLAYQIDNRSEYLTGYCAGVNQRTTVMVCNRMFESI